MFFNLLFSWWGVEGGYRFDSTETQWTSGQIIVLCCHRASIQPGKGREQKVDFTKTEYAVEAMERSLVCRL